MSRRSGDLEPMARPTPPPPFGVSQNQGPGRGGVTLPLSAKKGGQDHFAGFGYALDQALFNSSGSGTDTDPKQIQFSATLTYVNPGIIIEYIATLT